MHMEVFVDQVTGVQEMARPTRTRSENPTMNTTVIEAQARYLIEDRIRATRPRQSVHDRRRRLRALSWL
jgi:hypothetical protein